MGETARNVDTLKLYQAALAAGVAINPGPEWSTDKAYAGSRLRLCFASPSHEQIREGVAVLAEVCRKEFGVPERSANVERGETRLSRAKAAARASWIASLRSLHGVTASTSLPATNSKRLRKGA